MQYRHSYSKTHNDATFLRLKQDAMRNGQAKSGNNIQIGTGYQIITDVAVFSNSTYTLTLIAFMQAFSS